MAACNVCGKQGSSYGNMPCRVKAMPGISKVSLIPATYVEQSSGQDIV